MIDTSMSGVDYNRFTQLDGIEDRIIYYLLSPNPDKKTPMELEQTYRIWKILYYNDLDALSKPLPKYSEVTKLIYNGRGTQQGKRIFRSPRLEDSFVEECSMIKVYIDSIIPIDRIKSIVNVGVDVVVNTNIINLEIPENEAGIIDEIDGEYLKVQTTSRVTALTKAILSLLNGADIQGVGRMIFSREQSIYNQSQYGLWNNRNFEGIKSVIGVTISGVN